MLKSERMKPKYCKCGCGEVLQYPKIGKQWVDRKHYTHWLNTSDAGQAAIVKAARKAIEKRKKEQRQKDNQVRESLKTLNDWKKELEGHVNKIAVLIDRGNGCISCGGTNTPQAGHFHSVKANPALRYNLHNLWLQDYFCNVKKSANIIQYNRGLRELISKEYQEFVEMDLVRLCPNLHLRIDDIKKVIPIAKQIIKELSSETTVNTSKDRVLLRDKYNTILNIYQQEQAIYQL